MSRLPADGKSVQSHSSGSIQSTPSLSAAPAAEKTTGQEDDHEDAGRPNDAAGDHMLSAEAMAEPVPDASAIAPASDADETEVGRTGDARGQEVESSTSMPSGEGAIPAPEDAATASQEAFFPAARPGPEVGNLALHDGASAVMGTDRYIGAASVLDKDTKLPDSDGVEKRLQAFTAPTPSCADDGVVADSCSAVDTGATAVAPPSPSPPSVLAEANAEFVDGNSGAATTIAGPAAETDVATTEEQRGGQTAVAGQGKENEGEAAMPRTKVVGENSEAVTTAVADPAAETGVETTEEQRGGQALAFQGRESDGETTAPRSPRLEEEQDTKKSNREIDGEQDSEAEPEREDAFIPSECFTRARPGYVFKTGDKGLGFYVEGYVDQPVKGKPLSSHRPWNAGPGEQAIRRGPLGPIPKPFKKIVPFRTREEKKAAEESDM